jgi:serine/threonine-protein kinase
LIRLLGEGGMAEVWLAQRADGSIRREVALKLPMLRRDREDLSSRFARERDILAALEHPHIARLYDAGVSPDGLPYLATEYVRGERLTAWCDNHRLGVNERLRLVLQVLDALQYAHAHHVIHSDIKPSNILVNEAGHVQLLDFGVAKLLEQHELQTDLTIVSQGDRSVIQHPHVNEIERFDKSGWVGFTNGHRSYKELVGTREPRYFGAPRHQRSNQRVHDQHSCFERV